MLKSTHTQSHLVLRHILPLLLIVFLTFWFIKMIEIYTLLKGILYGFSIGMLVGPIAILCIRTTVNHGFLDGFITGIGAATADIIYGIIVGLGFSGLACFLEGYSFWIQLFGGSYLLYLGLKNILSDVQRKTVTVKNVKPWNLFVTTFFLTMTSPSTLLIFISFFSGLDIDCQTITIPLIFIAGFTIGSIIWWLCLTLAVSSVRKRLTQFQLNALNFVSGLMISGFGSWSLFKAFHP